VARFVSSPDTFLVEELPAYLPSGAGEHTFAWIEKRSLTTWDAIARLAGRLGVEARDVGAAGMKDRQATTRQWLSFPRVPPEAILATSDDLIRVLRAIPHGNKLRTGHLRGNRFEVILDDVDPADAPPLLEALDRLAREGLPNEYGEQRFGRARDNAAQGLEILRGTRRERDGRKRRLLVSAAQSAVFNAVLEARARDGTLRRVLSGDVLQKTAGSAAFVTEDPVLDQARLDAGEIVITGPLPGSWAREPPPDTSARAIEDQALAACGVEREEFAKAGKELPGARRPLLVPVTLAPATELPVPAPDTRRLRVGFELPAGTYATVLIEALGVTLGDGPPRSA
jgi:tRNA pseudouridine13 synthase